MYMQLKPHILVRSCRCKQATLQKPDASSNCWPSVEGAPSRTSLADRARGSSSRGRPSKQSGEVKISRTCWGENRGPQSPQGTQLPLSHKLMKFKETDLFSNQLYFKAGQKVSPLLGARCCYLGLQSTTECSGAFGVLK